MSIKSLNLQGLNISIFKKGKIVYLYIYNNNYYCFIKISSSVNIKLKSTTIIEFWSKHKIDDIKFYIKQFYLNEYSKIKFTGKGYKIKKNTQNSLVLLFNRAHTTTLWWKNLFLKKLKKYKMYIKYTPSNRSIINTIINVRYINIFTKKGLRQSRQILLKKKGKK